MTDTTVLDNVVWHASTGVQAPLATRDGSAVRFVPEVSPFSAISEPSPEAWDDLARLVGPGVPAVLFAPTVELPSGWTQDMTIPCLQMVATDVVDASSALDLEVLGPDDVDDMLELVRETKPGPFGRRTIELGTYLGLREEGRLVAMGGERFKVPGFTEVSAVCTTSTHVRRGLGAACVLGVLERIHDRGEMGFLHVVDDNTSAIALYEKLGFTIRTKAAAVIARRES